VVSGKEAEVRLDFVQFRFGDDELGVAWDIGLERDLDEIDP
jgi:hypothetical protein